jgi:hypothetical protein
MAADIHANYTLYPLYRFQISHSPGQKGKPGQFGAACCGPSIVGVLMSEPQTVRFTVTEPPVVLLRKVMIAATVGTVIEWYVSSPRKRKIHRS